MAFLSRQYRAPKFEIFWIIASIWFSWCDLLALRTLFRAGISVRPWGWHWGWPDARQYLGTRSEHRAPPSHHFQTLFPQKWPFYIILWGWSTFSDTAPWYFDLLSLALRDAMDRFWREGSKGTKHNAPTQKLGGIPGWSWPDSERLHRFPLNVIMRGLPDVVFDITWLI